MNEHKLKVLYLRAIFQLLHASANIRTSAINGQWGLMEIINGINNRPLILMEINGDFSPDLY